MKAMRDWSRCKAIGPSVVLTTLLVSIGFFSMSSASPSQETKMPTASIGKNVIKLEVAQTNHEIQRGLMFRTSLDKDSGMVFIFNPKRKVSFWMYNTLIPLDMIFVLDGKIVRIEKDVPPCKSHNPRDCPTYPEGDGVFVSEVVEVTAGYCDKHGIKEGDSIAFSIK